MVLFYDKEFAIFYEFYVCINSKISVIKNRMTSKERLGIQLLSGECIVHVKKTQNQMKNLIVTTDVLFFGK